MRLSFYWRSGYNIYVVESRRLQQIWTNCEHARKWSKNAWFQNFQINTCKNEPAKPVFMRALRGDRRNEKSPFRALTHHTKFERDVFGKGRNEKSPFRALTPMYFSAIAARLASVEMKKARSGRWHTKPQHGTAGRYLNVEMKKARSGRWHAVTCLFTDIGLGLS